MRVRNRSARTRLPRLPGSTPRGSQLRPDVDRPRGDDADGNAAVKDKIAQPDNAKYSETMRTRFIGEDGSGHLNNAVWAYNIDTKVLSRVLSVPAGGECTGLQAVDNLNGFTYVMSAMQHCGDWAWNATQLTPGGLRDTVAANWGGLMKQAANGYISGLPTLT